MTDIYFVSSRSENGKKLIENYPVYDVPSAIYIYNTPLGESGENKYVAASLYEKTTDTSVFIQKNLDKLMTAKQEGA